MDLGAYQNIEKLQSIVTANKIYVPRCRGYRLMSEEKPVSKEDIDDMISRASLFAVTWYVRRHGGYNRRCRKYITYFDWSPSETSKIRWENIHGKHRKAIKFAIKQQTKAILKQYEMFNRFAGQNDILYIHSRTGGGNWGEYGREVMDNPGYICHVFDAFDETYCDAYFRIKEVVTDGLRESENTGN